MHKTYKKAQQTYVTLTFDLWPWNKNSVLQVVEKLQKFIKLSEAVMGNCVNGEKQFSNDAENNRAVASAISKIQMIHIQAKSIDLY